jgi:hypothetical protein
VAKEISEELGFTPCTDDRCKLTELHPAHKAENPNKRTACPECKGLLSPLPHKRMKCVKCDWRGHRDPRKVSEHHA